MSYDLLILGGGPAGVTAALRGRELGASVALIEKGRFGGTCTNDGCVPTRVLARTARLARETSQAPDYGITTGGAPRVDLARTMEKTREVVDTVRGNKRLYEHLLHSGVDVFAGNGQATFTDAHSVTFPDGRTIEAETVIICVGGHAKKLPIPGAEHARTASDIWGLDRLPESVAVIGAGATGCQLASVFNSFGSRTTLLDIMPTILPGEDPDVAETMTNAFEHRGLRCRTGIDGVDGIEERNGGYALRFRENGLRENLEVELVIMATGWAGSTADLGLETAGVRTERGYVRVDGRLATSVPHIFGAGDVIGKTMLVQNAATQARLAAENAVLGYSTTREDTDAPHGGFTDPEYGSVGLSESAARKAHATITASVPFADLDRAIIDGQTDGFIKLVVDRESHAVLGAHVVGEQAVEIVEMVAAGMSAGVRVDQLANLQLAYPTFVAIVGLAAREIVRRLGVMPVSAEWRSLPEAPRGAEWERSET